MQRDRQLSILLWLGGVPPVLSGILASAAPTWYLGMTGVTGALSPAANEAMAFLWHLQGGDAWVAGLARIAVAILGTMALKQVMVLIMILHSSYELWLIPTHAFPWCSDHPSVCTPLYINELWGFMALHAVLIAGSVLALWSQARHSSAG